MITDFDEEQASLIDTMYATPDVVAQRQFVLGLLDLQPGERVLDIGPGQNAQPIASEQSLDAATEGA